MGILHEECFGGKDELSKLVGPSHNAEFISQGEGSKSVKLELDRHTSPSGRFGAAWALFLNIRMHERKSFSKVNFRNTYLRSNWPYSFSRLDIFQKID